LSGVSGAAACATTNGPSSGAARLAEGSAAIVSNAVLVNSSELTFKRIGRRGFMVVQAPGWRFCAE
jgi:hypothetical protein